MHGRQSNAIGSLIKAAQARIEAINAEKAELVSALGKLLTSLGGDTPASGPRRGRPASRGRNKGGRRPGFKMSAEAKAKISAAAKKRWAAVKAKEGKRG